ncbi:hypothetical protein JTB14_003584 [Gonioctena quinquepunctata]|nr:hypothetical protein JTB14_003584 [Gonioctena quinquepunctata]
MPLQNQEKSSTLMLRGPMEVNSIGESVFLLFLKDDSSHHRYNYFLKDKNEVIHKLTEFIPKFRTETNGRIEILRTDNGTKFKNEEGDQLLRKFEMKHHFTVKYTPEQNGSVEREMRTLIEAARTSLHHRQL